MTVKTFGDVACVGGADAEVVWEVCPVVVLELGWAELVVDVTANLVPSGEKLAPLYFMSVNGPKIVLGGPPLVGYRTS